MVAVKLMKEGSSHEERVKFLQEAAIMRQFNNLNIVKMHGIVYAKEKVSTTTKNIYSIVRFFNIGNDCDGIVGKW